IQLQFLFSFFSIILCVYTALKYVRKSIFEQSTKELIIAQYAFCSIHAVALGVTQLLHLVYRYSALTPCDSQIPKIIYPGVFGWITFHDEPPLEGLTPYCTSMTKSTAFMMMLNLYVLVAFDILSTLSTLFLWWYNRVMLKKERQQYNLKKTFHRKQCIYGIRQFLPVTVIHTVTYIIMLTVYSYAATIGKLLTRADFTFLNSAINVIPYYCLLAPLTLMLLIRHGRFKRTNLVRGFIAARRDDNSDVSCFQENLEKIS
ncbi:hypothetical protein PMAYCL1PPCAC_03525, partial [Pristionchus mayeri]